MDAELSSFTSAGSWVYERGHRLVPKEDSVAAEVKQIFKRISICSVP